jgi:hypothetical protein
LDGNAVLRKKKEERRKKKEERNIFFSSGSILQIPEMYRVIKG